jgi:hypothetical protein
VVSGLEPGIPYHMERRRLRQNFFETCLTDKTTSSGKSGDWLLEIGDWECMIGV